MEYITLNNGVNMPLIGYGTWNLRQEECILCVQNAIECGYRLIDTARMYDNEVEVGKGIKKSGIQRDQLFITTKLDSKCDSYELASKAIQDSLNNLQTDYIDLILIHEPYEHCLEMYTALEEAYRNGFIRAIGISNFNHRRLDLFLKKCTIVPAVNQIESHVFYPQLEFVQYMQNKNIFSQAWSPLAQGKENIFENPILKEIGFKYDKTPAQIALRFLLQNKISVVPKTVHRNRMKENLDIFDFSLSEEEQNMIKTLNMDDTLSDWTKGWA